MNWRNWFKFRYTLFLEQERDRLLAELRLWQDAALISKGLPKLTPREVAPLPQTKPRMLPSQWRAQIEARHPEQEKKSDGQN